MSSPKEIVDLQDGCGEGPIWDARARRLYWVDIAGARLHTYDPESRQVSSTKPGVPISAVTLTESDDLLIAGGNGVWLWNDHGKRTHLVSEADGLPFAVNDAIADPRGRLLAGTAFFSEQGNYSPGALYSIDIDGHVSKLDAGFGLANGLGFSPDQSTLYFTDSVARTIYRYDYAAETGAARNRRVFVKVPENEGIPDGLTVDAEGFVWSAQWFGSGVVRYDPDGMIERRVAIPAAQTSSLAFAGPDLTDIFITTAAVPDALSLAPTGYQAPKNIGGQLFHTNAGISGRQEYRCRIAAR